MNQTRASLTLGTLQTLDQWNCEQQAAWSDLRRKISSPQDFPNGLVCPADGGNLYDTGQEFPETFGSPAKLRVKCCNADCKFRGERIKRATLVTD